MQPPNVSYIDSPVPPPYSSLGYPELTQPIYPQLQQPTNPFISSVPSAPSTTSVAPALQMEQMRKSSGGSKRYPNSHSRREIEEHKARIEDLEYEMGETKNCLACSVCCFATAVSAMFCGM